MHGRHLIPGSQSSNLCSPGIILLFGRAADQPTPRAIPIPKVRTLWDRYESLVDVTEVDIIQMIGLEMLRGRP
ncbi:MAG: hypothetical protein ACREJ5_29040, partial [Geminicoccaceae bacterium]